MKLSINSMEQAEVHGLNMNAFGFQSNAKMFSILFDKLYKNKEAAVIRELGCNAWDAHVDAGTTDKPFEIQLPTWLDKTFSIRDYGTGIPHDSFEAVYTNVGSSTKEDSNNMIGAYGLGSKTPFAIVDTFTVENYRDGKKSTWLCLLNGGMPQVSHVHTEDTDEPSGLRIMFTFEQGHHIEPFTRELFQQLKFFPVKPVITGGENLPAWDKLPDDMSGSYFYIPVVRAKGERWGTQLHFVLMGNVAYPFESEPLGLSWGTPEMRLLDTSNSLVLNANLGDVDIPPSRETVEYTQKTKDFIVGQLKKVAEEYVKETMDTLETLAQAGDMYKFKKYLQGVNRSMFTSKQDQTEITVGTESNTIRQWNYESHFMNVPVDVYPLSKAAYKIYGTNRIDLDEWEISNLYVNDLGNGGVKHLKDNRGLLTKNSYIFKAQKSYRKTTLDQDITDCVAHVTKVTGRTPVLLSSVIGYPTTTVTSTGKRKPVEQMFKIEQVDIHKSLSSQWEKVDTIPDSGVYFPVLRNSIDCSNTNRDNMEGIRSLAAFLKYHDGPVYLVRSRGIKQVKDKLTLGFDLIPDILADINKRIEEDNKITPVLNSMPHLIPKLELIKGIICKPVRTLIRYYAYMASRAKVDRFELVRDYGRLSVDGDPEMTKVVTTDDFEVPKKLQKLIEIYISKYQEPLHTLDKSWGVNLTDRLNAINLLTGEQQ